MARRAERPAALSQMPGAKMRGASASSMGSQAVPAGKTVSRWAEMRMTGTRVEGRVMRGSVGSSARTLPASSRWTLVRPRCRKRSRNQAARADSPKGGAGMRTRSSCQWRSWGWWRCSQWKARWTAVRVARRVMRRWRWACWLSLSVAGGQLRLRVVSSQVSEFGFLMLRIRYQVSVGTWVHCGLVLVFGFSIRLRRGRGRGRGRWGRRRCGCGRRGCGGWREGDAAAADFDEGADEVADHVVEEAVCR